MNAWRWVLEAALVVMPFGVPVPALLAQPADANALEDQVVAVDGRFVRYLRSAHGRVVGIVLADGTQARFAPDHHPSEKLRYGDHVLVRAEAAKGMGRQYLVNAAVTRTGGPQIDDLAVTQAGGKTRSPVEAHRPRKRGDAFSFDVKKQRSPTSGSAAAKAAAKIKNTTTGTAPSPTRERHWSRRRETSGP